VSEDFGLAGRAFRERWGFREGNQECPQTKEKSCKREENLRDELRQDSSIGLPSEDDRSYLKYVLKDLRT